MPAQVDKEERFKEVREKLEKLYQQAVSGVRPQVGLLTDSEILFLCEYCTIGKLLLGIPADDLELERVGLTSRHVINVLKEASVLRAPTYDKYMQCEVIVSGAIRGLGVVILKVKILESGRVVVKAVSLEEEK